MDQHYAPELLTPADLDDMLIDQPEEGRFEVGRRMFEDPAVFELEMRHIYESTWIYLCHESQVPNPHDYFAGRIGVNKVLVTRNGEGEVKAFLNSCTHRGAQLTTTKKGNQKNFMCPFHGWVFNSDGVCAVDGHDDGAYSDSFDQQDHNLVAVAKLDIYKGFIFASLSADVPPLTEFLGGATVAIDLLADQSPDGMEILKGEVRYRSKANWKTQLENIDGYHFFPTHLSYIGLIQKRMQEDDPTVKTIDATEMASLPGGAYEFENGHCMSWGFMPNGDDRPLGFQRERIEQQFGKEIGRWMIDHVRNLIIYPSVLFMDQSSTTIRMVHPVSATESLVEIYCIAPRNEPPEARERRIRQYEDFLGPAGLATSDDQNLFESCQRSVMSSQIPMMHGYGRGVTRIKPGVDKAGKAIGLNTETNCGSDHETFIHGSYRAWKEMMAKGLAS